MNKCEFCGSDIKIKMFTIISKRERLVYLCENCQNPQLLNSNECDMDDIL